MATVYIHAATIDFIKQILQKYDFLTSFRGCIENTGPTGNATNK